MAEEREDTANMAAETMEPRWAHNGANALTDNLRHTKAPANGNNSSQREAGIVLPGTTNWQTQSSRTRGNALRWPVQSLVGNAVRKRQAKRR